MMIFYPCDDANRCDPNPCGDGQTCVLDATNQPICECPEGSLLNSAGTCQVVASMAVDDFSDLVNYKFIRLRRSPSVSLYDNNGLVIDLASADASEITVLAEVEECGESLTVDECPLEKNSAILNGESATLSSLIFLKSVNQRLRFSLRKNGVNFLPDIWSISGEFVIKDGLEAAPWNITWTGDHSTKNADQFGNFDLDNITFYYTDVDDHVAVPAGNYFLSLRIVAFDSWGPEDMFFLDENYGGSVMSSGIFELTLSDTCAQECNANGYCHPTASTFGTPSCVCNDGYEGDGVDYCIEVIDECTSNPCPAEQECTADDCLDIDECADNLHVCSDGTSCENTFGGYFCNADNNQPSCDPNCDAGFFCDSATETCVDIDECSEGTHDCKDFESCRNTNGKFMCDFDNSQCRDDLPRPEWKGRSGMRYVYQSSNGAVMGMKFKNKFKTVNIRNELYTGVIMFTKTVCGMDFLRALQDGRVRIDLVDSSPLYQMHDFHYKNQQKYSAIGFTFDLLSIETKDMPWSFKSGIPTKNMGSDDVYISFTGLEQVNWLTNQENCLLLGAQAALPYDDFDEVDRACFVDLKTFWKTPPLPNP
ncbi:Oidioi.mRNA.OKI2018_I69.chr2.g3961.t1.cds [Oikopleura dioica]|uniref:Oidioi.mRNA.OKI2018_I69.chr2.g3961.t1.cds n=1 Tax=Oikopleura dioica TaxID=34765 RepID=A0ABN7T013_OIKDI|nr:Oidioi.mRNA.OKI2018_I69.chr2.g3961.t1.cds [Oikopleura dioica]